MLDASAVMELFYSDKMSDSERNSVMKFIIGVVPIDDKRKMLKDIVDNSSDEDIEAIFDLIGFVISDSDIGKEVLDRKKRRDNEEDKKVLKADHGKYEWGKKDDA